MKKKVFNIIETILLIASCLICVFVLAQKFIFKNNGVFGYSIYVIVTSSMQPDLEVGDIILDKKVDADKLKINDIITYIGMESDYKGKVITHKIKNIIEEDGKKIFYTKGIVNNTVDPAVYEDQIYGKLVYKFKLISFISKIVRSKFGFIFIVFIPLIIISVKELINLKKLLK